MVVSLLGNLDMVSLKKMGSRHRLDMGCSWNSQMVFSEKQIEMHFRSLGQGVLATDID